MPVAGSRDRLGWVFVPADKLPVGPLARMYNDQASSLARVSSARAHSTANSAPNTTTFAAA